MKSIQIALFGAQPDTSNLGVSALFASIISSLSNRIPNCKFVVFDNGLGVRSREFHIGSNERITVELRGVRAGKRLDRSENFINVLACARLGTVGSLLNSNVACIDACDAVLDISGGDSFSDIYGGKRFFTTTATKELALLRKRTLILMPQTYGPYNSEKAKAKAKYLVRHADMCWARDERSFQILKDLLGDKYSPDHHKNGVDMAFLLQPRQPALSNELASVFASNREATPLVGFNISGLIYNDPSAATNQYHFKADYHKVVTDFLRQLLSTTTAKVLLIPHVMVHTGLVESDPRACEDVFKLLSGQFPNRIVVLPSDLDQSEVKWCISQCDWFCGTRMHATIGALSSLVPTATVNYSDKAKGVFESCKQGDQVFDPRKLDTASVVDALLKSYAARQELKDSLAQAIPVVVSQARDQVNLIADCIMQARNVQAAS